MLLAWFLDLQCQQYDKKVTKGLTKYDCAMYLQFYNALKDLKTIYAIDEHDGSKHAEERWSQKKKILDCWPAVETELL